VSTAVVANREPASRTWEIVSGTCAAIGAPVRSGEIIYLRSLYTGNGGYLDAGNGDATSVQKTGGDLRAISALASVRTPGVCVTTTLSEVAARRSMLS
jgi:hypothetical protein